MLRVALSHDVDRVKKSYQYITGIIRSIITSDLKQVKNHCSSVFRHEPYWNFSKIIEIENDYGIKSTFFFMNETIRFNLFDISNWKLSLGRYKLNNPSVVELVKWLDRNGWEIGLHGSFLSFKNINLLLSEKELLEKIVGHEINGIRQHYLNLDENTWEIQKEIGFKYDSTFGYTREIGFKDNVYNYFQPFGDDFIVFPLIIMDDCFMKKRDKWNEFLKIVDIASGKESLLVINWHQRVFNEKEFPEYLTFYVKILNELKRKGAKFYRLSDYYEEIRTNYDS